MKQTENYSASESRLPNVSRNMQDDSRANADDEFSNFQFRPIGEARSAPSLNSQESAGAPYANTKNWQTQSNRSSYGNMATQDTTTETRTQSETDQMITIFFDAGAGSQGTVHGCILRCPKHNIEMPTIYVHQLQFNSWHGTTATWESIPNLP